MGPLVGVGASGYPVAIGPPGRWIPVYTPDGVEPARVEIARNLSMLNPTITLWVSDSMFLDLRLFRDGVLVDRIADTAIGDNPWHTSRDAHPGDASAWAGLLPPGRIEGEFAAAFQLDCSLLLHAITPLIGIGPTFFAGYTTGYDGIPVHYRKHLKKLGSRFTKVTLGP